MFEKLTYYMDNGFKVVLHKDRSEKIITAGIVVNYGSMNETNEDNGLAHFIEHILTSDNHDQSSMSLKMEKMRESGAMYNAQTDKENTSFYICGMSDNLKLYLELLADIVFFHREYADEIFENEKRVVERELVSYYSSFNQITGRAIQALYSDAGVGRIIVGKRDNVREFTKDIVLNKIDDVYVPENTAIVVSGDFEYEDAKKLIEEFFGNIADKPVNKLVEPVQLTPSYFFNPQFNGESSVLSLCYRKVTNENRSKIGNICELFLKAMLDPVLFQRMGYDLRMKDGISYNIGGFGSFTGQFLSLGVTAIFHSSRLFDAYQIMRESLEQMREYGFTESELEKAKRNCITNRIYKHCNLKEQSLELLKKVKYSDTFSPDNEIREIRNLEITEVNNVLKDILSPDSLGFACIGNCEFDALMEKYIV